MKSLLLLPALLCLLPASAESWRFVSKVEELPVEVTDRLEITRPKVRLCGGESEESTDCVLCTVCHPHEYELIGCSGQMDSVCASCTTGWMRSTPKTVDFFRKCKKHPQLPFLFPDVPYPMRLETAPSSMFAEQERMLHDAENTETAEMDEEMSEETDDYEDDEDEEEAAVSGEREDEEEDVSMETGVKPVDVDERDDDWITFENDDFFSETEQESEEDDEEPVKEDFEASIENEDSAEVKDEERADPFDSKNEEDEEEAADDEAAGEDEDDSEEYYRLYPLRKANIWRIIGPELTPYDDKGISKELRDAISDRKKFWKLEQEVNRILLTKKNIRLDSDEVNENYDDMKQEVQGGYRPLPVHTFYVFSADVDPQPLLAFVWVLCFFVMAVVVVVSFRICMLRRRNRVMVLPQLDDMSRMLIDEAHARVHGKKEKLPRPEFV